MEKETFVFRISWYKVLKNLPGDIQLEVYNAIMSYASGEGISDLSAMASVAFAFIKEDIDKDLAKYSEKIERRREAGKSGSEKRWGEKSEKSDNEQAENQDVIPSDSKNSKSNKAIAKDSKNSKSHFCQNLRSDGDGDGDGVYENNEKDKSFSCYSLTPNPFEGLSEEKKQQFLFFLSEFFFRNYTQPNIELDNCIAYNRTGGRKWDQMSDEERNSCIRLWKQKDPNTGKVIPPSRFPPRLLGEWKKIFTRLSGLNAPPEVLLEALSDKIAFNPVKFGNFTISLPGTGALFRFIQEHHGELSEAFTSLKSLAKCEQVVFRAV